MAEQRLEVCHMPSGTEHTKRLKYSARIRSYRVLRHGTATTIATANCGGKLSGIRYSTRHDLINRYGLTFSHVCSDGRSYYL